jgi:hypothetical protein
MTSLEEFAKNFAPDAVPLELEQLLAFQEGGAGFGEYADGFGLNRDDKGGLKSWSSDPAFLSRLLPFATANGSGSFYALWADGNSEGASSFPVVAFGDEGGAHVVAENLRALLRILAFDVEPRIDLGGVSYDRYDDKHTRSHDAYVQWLSGLGLEPAADPMTIVDAAQAKHKAAFDAWFADYYQE